MTRQLSFNAKKILTGFLFSLIVILFAPAAHAQENRNDSTESPYVVRYLGTEEQMQVFTLQIDASEGNKYIVEIKESGDNTLFKQMYYDEKITKTFKIPKDIENLNFIIRNLKDNTVQTYTVNSIVKVYDDVVVRKIK